jgi:hypothetical protein
LNGENLYTCHGPVRAMAKPLYKKMRFKFSGGEDMYSYMYALVNSFKYAYVKNTEVYYRLPGNLTDHRRQSVRFFNSRKRLAKIFDKKVADRETYLPRKLVFKSFIRNIFHFPLCLPLYFITVLILDIESAIFPRKNLQDLWSISKSSKILDIK